MSAQRRLYGACFLAAACSHSPQQIDAPPRHDARIDAHADASLCGGVTSPCNTLANLGTQIQATCIAGSAPAMTGGPILDGTYVLVSAQAYASSCNGLTLPPGGPTTLQVAGSCMESIDAQGGAQNYALSETGNQLALDRTCAGPLTYTLQYTATATTYSELAPFSAGVMIVSVFQKQ